VQPAAIVDSNAIVLAFIARIVIVQPHRRNARAEVDVRSECIMSETPSDPEILARLHAEIAVETDAIAALRAGISTAEAEIAKSKSERYWELREVSSMDGFVAGLISIATLGLAVATVVR
jgi:hypothetical protein